MRIVNIKFKINLLKYKEIICYVKGDLNYLPRHNG